MRQVILDTETTGLSVTDKHRLTEIGCLELIDRQLTGKTFQTYLDPEREIDKGAALVTGLTREFLTGKPKFKDIVDEFLAFIEGAELIIHNAPFDIGFLDYELSLIQHPWQSVTKKTTVLDTLTFARKKYPGQRNSLDALCKRLNIDNTNRKYHGALLDSEILAKVYLSMTAGQTTLDNDIMSSSTNNGINSIRNNSANNEMNGDQINTRNNATTNNGITSDTTIISGISISSTSNISGISGVGLAASANKITKTWDLNVLKATSEELLEHQEYLKLLDEKSNNNCKWPKD